MNRKIALLNNSLNKFLYIFSMIALITSIVLINVFFTNRQEASAETKNELMSQVEQAEQMYVTAEIEKNQAIARADECQRKIDEANEKMPIYQEQLNQRLVLMYKNNVASNNLLSLFIQSENLDVLLNNLEYYFRINKKTNELMQECLDLKHQAEEAQDEILPAIAEAELKEIEAQSIIDKAKSAIAELEAADIHIQLPEEQSYSPEPGGGGYIPSPTPVPPPSPGPTPGGSTIVDRALSCIGLPYGWASAGPYSFDCSGLVSFSYTGDYVHYWSTYTIRDSAGNGLNGWYRTNTPSNGTCCCSMNHCGIYYNGMMIHAPEPGDYVKIGPIQGDMLFYDR